LLSKPEPLTEQGFFWLCVWIANTWAGDSGRPDDLKTDKIPIKDRYRWTLDNAEIICAYAQNPKLNDGWMKADEPWQFLAACFEFDAAWKDGNPDYNYTCGLVIYVDGTINGTQHLVALTKDEVIAPYVNLTNQDFPGDLYTHVGENLWKEISEEYNKQTATEILYIERLVDKYMELKQQLGQLRPDEKVRKEAIITELQQMNTLNQNRQKQIAMAFWLRIHTKKEKRKIVKRGTMTIS